MKGKAAGCERRKNMRGNYATKQRGGNRPMNEAQCVLRTAAQNKAPGINRVSVISKGTVLIIAVRLIRSVTRYNSSIEVKRKKATNSDLAL